MARATTEQLRARLRSLVGDAASDAELTEDELEAHLDANAELVRLPLSPFAPVSGSATVWRAPLAPWEADAQVVDAAGNVVSVSALDTMNGIVTLPEPRSDQLYIQGRLFDLWGAAADVLEALAARARLAYDVSIDGTSLSRSQMAEATLAAAREYRRRARPRVAQTVRTDLAGGGA